MIGRLSTAGLHAAAVSDILRQQSALARTQSQVASGLRIQSPADDPIATTRILGIEKMQAQLAQYGKNSDIIASRLGTAEQALADLGTLLERARELALQANNGTLDKVSLASIATELRSRAQEVVEVGNRRDTNGEFLFSGYSTQVQPFARSGADVAYAGDQGVRQLQISPTQKLADGLNGERVFMGIREGNGTFAVATGVHNGSGTIDSGQVVDISAWHPGSYTIEFTSADSWRVLDAQGDAVLDAGGNAVAGSYEGSGVIAFNGIQVQVTGAPAAGDSFAITPAGTKDIFQTLDELVSALASGTDTQQSRALLSSNINRAITQLDQGLSHVIDLRAEVGARLSAVDSAELLRENTSLELASSLSDLRDLDYAEAISRMNQQLTGLQAAQAAYTRIGQMSLFDYL